MTRLALSIDVEEYFHVENLRPIAPPSSWDGFPSRVEAQVDRLLDLFDAHQARATFFVLGWVAERHGALVRRIAARGHELASHGHGHVRLHELDPETFRADLRRSRAAIEDAAGEAVHGYRAPTWSITPATAWAFDVLIEEGFAWDSSVFPVRHDRYGDPSAPITPWVVRRPAGEILEIPPLVLRVGRTNLPAAGGGYLRLFPLAWVRWAIDQAIREGRRAVLYLHPWEIDPDQPRLPVGFLRGVRHYRGLAGVEAKLARLLSEHEWAAVGSLPRQSPGPARSRSCATT